MLLSLNFWLYLNFSEEKNLIRAETSKGNSFLYYFQLASAIKLAIIQLTILHNIYLNFQHYFGSAHIPIKTPET